MLHQADIGARPEAPKQDEINVMLINNHLEVIARL
jgi:hypothetical protein